MNRLITCDLYKITFSYLMINIFFFPIFAYGVYQASLVFEYLAFIGVCCGFLIICSTTSDPQIKIELDAWLEARLRLPVMFFMPVTMTKLEKESISKADKM